MPMALIGDQLDGNAKCIRVPASRQPAGARPKIGLSAGRTVRYSWRECSFTMEGCV